MRAVSSDHNRIFLVCCWVQYIVPADLTVSCLKIFLLFSTWRYYPFDSGPSASSCNKAVLEDIVAAIDAAARPNGPPLPSSQSFVPCTPSSSPAAPSAIPAAAAATPLTIGNAPESRYSAAVGAAGRGEIGRSNGSSCVNGIGTIDAIGNNNGIGTANGNSTDTVSGNGMGNDNIIGNDVGNSKTTGNVVGNGNGTVSINDNGWGAGAVRESAAKQIVLDAASKVNGVGNGLREEECLLQNVAASSDTAATAVVAATDGEPAALVLKPQEANVARAENGDQTAEMMTLAAVGDEKVLPPASLAEVRMLGTVYGKGEDRERWRTVTSLR